MKGGGGGRDFSLLITGDVHAAPSSFVVMRLVHSINLKLRQKAPSVVRTFGDSIDPEFILRDKYIQ